MAIALPTPGPECCTTTCTDSGGGGGVGPPGPPGQQGPPGPGGLAGTGSPLGVVTASPGTTYIDVTIPSQPALWLKVVGTNTTNGWVQVLGP
jgi:hypothetical protein